MQVSSKNRKLSYLCSKTSIAAALLRCVTCSDYVILIYDVIFLETNTELDESGLSFGDSMMEELDKSQGKNFVIFFYVANYANNEIFFGGGQFASFFVGLGLHYG